MSRRDYDPQQHPHGHTAVSTSNALIVFEDIAQFIVVLCLLSFVMNTTKYVHPPHHITDRRGQWCPGVLSCFPLLVLRLMLFPYYWWMEKGAQEYPRYDCDPCHIHHFYHANQSDESERRDDGRQGGFDFDMFQDLSNT